MENKYITLNKNFPNNHNPLIIKGSRLVILQKTESGYKCEYKYFGRKPEIFYLHKHWFEEDFVLPEKIISKFISNNDKNNFTLNEIKSKLSNYYDKEDVSEIIKTLTDEKNN